MKKTEKFIKISLLGFLLVFPIGCSEKKVPISDIPLESIIIDIDDHKEKTNGSLLIDTTNFEIIPLETNDSCLVSEITKMHIRGNKIIIYDRRQQGAFIFNRDGTFHAKVHAIGEGPEEYPIAVNDFVITDHYIGVLTPVIGKIILYDFDGKFVKSISLNGGWADTFFTFDEKEYYLVNEWSNSQKGNYFLFKLNPEDNIIKPYLPFAENNQRGWGLINYYSLCKNRALILYSSIDTIYSVSKNKNIKPAYYVNIVKKKLPTNLAKGNGRIALEKSISDGYITGINKIMESKKYIMLIDSDDNHIVYDKKEKRVKAISNYFYFPSWGNFSFTFSKAGQIENEILLYYWSSDFAIFDRDHNQNKNFNNKEFETKFRYILNNIHSSEENPILFLFKLQS